MFKILSKFFGSRNKRLIKQMYKVVAQINALEPKISALSDEDLKQQTERFRERLAKGESLDKILPAAFATVREASKRTLKMRHFDVQLIGGMVLHQGKISEMLTGEGKTLMATLPAYLNALTSKGVHIVTVNDYLAKRDAEWMGPIYKFLGLTVGVIVADLETAERQDAYAADITYGTNNEFGFDYLRDNMALRAEDRVQRPLNFGIVDEVDSILIDEARTPLIISGAAEDSSELYKRMDSIAPKLTRQAPVKEGEEEGPGDYSVDEKSKQVYLTEAGQQHVETLLKQEGLLDETASLYEPANIALLHHVNAALRAHVLFQRDVDYIVQNNQVVIVDEHTGRSMPGRRWSDGLHQAVEAKEGVQIQNENQTLASITFQNYFRLYQKLSGMTGTAETEAFEFHQIYGLDVVVIPSNKPCVRQDNADQIYLTLEEKFTAIVNDIKARLEKHQPILVGTASIEVSELLSRLLNKDNIAHQVLNAKFHEKEAQIIAEAGLPGAVTIATNMAGRGTDIVLGGNLEVEMAALKNPTDEQIAALNADWQKRHQQVLEAGGLYVLGTERHESRRIDNQLRGRSGRQGDPGSSRFYLSMKDNLMRIFASDRVSALMQKLGMEEGEAIEHPWVSRAIENAQRKVEGHNFDIRKQLLEYDDVANDQRKVVYDQRGELLESQDIGESIRSLREEVIQRAINDYIPPESMPEQWDVPGLEKQLEKDFVLKLPIEQWLADETDLHEENLRTRILEKATEAYAAKEAVVGEDIMRQFERSVMMRSLDIHWKEHLAAMDYLRQGIHLRGYAQKNPKQEYKRESFELFSEMLERIRYDVVSLLMRVQLRPEGETQMQAASTQPKRMQYSHTEMNSLTGTGAGAAVGGAAGQPRPQGQAATQQETYIREGRKVGRNEPCPCNSGKKYKHCHGKVTA